MNGNSFDEVRAVRLKESLMTADAAKLCDPVPVERGARSSLTVSQSLSDTVS